MRGICCHSCGSASTCISVWKDGHPGSTRPHDYSCPYGVKESDVLCSHRAPCLMAEKTSSQAWTRWCSCLWLLAIRYGMGRYKTDHGSVGYCRMTPEQLHEYESIGHTAIACEGAPCRDRSRLWISMTPPRVGSLKKPDVVESVWRASPGNCCSAA